MGLDGIGDKACKHACVGDDHVICTQVFVVHAEDNSAVDFFAGGRDQNPTLAQVQSGF